MRSGCGRCDWRLSLHHTWESPPPALLTCANSSWLCMNILSCVVAGVTQHAALRVCLCGLLCVDSKRGSLRPERPTDVCERECSVGLRAPLPGATPEYLPDDHAPPLHKRTHGPPWMQAALSFFLSFPPFSCCLFWSTGGPFPQCCCSHGYRCGDSDWGLGWWARLRVGETASLCSTEIGDSDGGGSGLGWGGLGMMRGLNEGSEADGACECA